MKRCLVNYAEEIDSDIAQNKIKLANISVIDLNQKVGKNWSFDRR